jgi:hypothetical protein
MKTKFFKSPSAPLRLTVIVECKHPRMPRFVVVPSKALASWWIKGTTVVECTLNGVEIGRRTLKRWDDHRWFIDLPESLCRRVRIDTGDSVTLTLRIASTLLPEELARLIANDPVAKGAWEKLTPSQQRMLREHVAAAKQSATRERRAARALCQSMRNSD